SCISTRSRSSMRLSPETASAPISSPASPPPRSAIAPAPGSAAALPPSRSLHAADPQPAQTLRILWGAGGLGWICGATEGTETPGDAMDFEPTESQRKLVEMVRDLCVREVKPHAAEWDREERFPREVVEQLGELGLLGMTVPEDMGGAALDTVSVA